ncbi:MAG: hypothetical protein QG591_2642 [Planctomycetota bacterium]|nr:hypothetical protein [Planctomycetota bacterium]
MVADRLSPPISLLANNFRALASLLPTISFRLELFAIIHVPPDKLRYELLFVTCANHKRNDSNPHDNRKVWKKLTIEINPEV